MKKIVLSVDRIMIPSKDILLNKLKKYFDEVEYSYGNRIPKDEEGYLYKILKSLKKYNFLEEFCKNRINKIEWKYNEKIMKKFLDADFVLMIGGLYYTEEFIKFIKQRNKNIKFIIFLWDKFSKVEISNLKKSYDKVYTFERSDAIENNIFWHPSFFLEEEETEKKIDCYYLGNSRNEERYKYIERLYKRCIKLGLKPDLNLLSKKVKLEYEKNIQIKKPISYKENLERIKRAKVTIEININDQKGLTLRSLECLAYRTKLITTNEDIKNYDFYNEANIYILKDLEDIDSIPKEFFLTKYEEIDKEILDRYSFEGFIEEIFKEER